MALSGNFSKSVGSHWDLRVEWSATQNISANTSSVTVKLFWMASSSGAVNASATKDCAIQINGGTWSTKSASGMASLSNGQKKQIHSYTQTINHASNGTATFSIDAYFDAEVTLSGTYYGRIDMDQKSFTLNTIPRESTLTSSPSWTAGSNLSLSISRASSSFTHTAKIYVDGTLIVTKTGVGASGSVVFDTAQNTSIFNELDTGSSKGTKIELLTYSGSTHIGTKSYTGTVKAPSRSTTTFTKSWDIGTTISGKITQTVGYFTHTIQLVFPSKTFTILNKTDVTDWTYNTSSIASELYALTPNSNTLTGQIRIYTYFGAEQVLSYAESDITAKVTGSNPTFTASQISYADVNATTKAVTGNANYIVQGQSDFTAYVNSVATAKNYATMKTYEITVNGVTKKLTAVGNTPFGKVNASSNISMKVRAIDSRGNYTEVTKTVEMIPYVQPIMTATAVRTNNFEAQTTISIKGSISLLPVAGANKNVITATTGVQYRYRESTANFVDGNTGWVNMTWTVSGANYTSNNVVLTLDNTKSFVFEYRVTDKLGGFKVTKTVSVGQPIMFLDSVKKAIGINKFPASSANALEVGGTITATNIKLSSQADANATSTGHGITIGDDAGISMKIDSNEIGSFQNGAFSSMFLNASGGMVGIGTNYGYVPNTVGLKVYNAIDIVSNGGDMLQLRGSDHGYIEYYVKGTTARSGYIGYGSNGVNMTFSNQIGDLHLTPVGSASWIMKSMDSHGGMQYLNRAQIKFLSTSNTIQVRSHDDAGWGNLSAIVASQSDRRSKSVWEEVEYGVLEKVRRAPVYNYQYKDDDKWHMGIMTDEAPTELVIMPDSDKEYESINQYSMISYLWKSVQELADQVDYLKEKVKNK